MILLIHHNIIHHITTFDWMDPRLQHFLHDAPQALLVAGHGVATHGVALPLGTLTGHHGSIPSTNIYTYTYTYTYTYVYIYIWCVYIYIIYIYIYIIYIYIDHICTTSKCTPVNIWQCMTKPNIEDSCKLARGQWTEILFVGIMI